MGPESHCSDRHWWDWVELSPFTTKYSQPPDNSTRKTEILLELGFRFRNRRNVFFIRAHDLESFQNAFLDISTGIGHDILASRYPTSDLARIWRGLQPSDRVCAFKSWLGDPENSDTIFIVDDLDGLIDDSVIKSALPSEARLILFSARDPSIALGLRRECQ